MGWHLVHINAHLDSNEQVNQDMCIEIVSPFPGKAGLGFCLTTKSALGIVSFSFCSALSEAIGSLGCKHNNFRGIVTNFVQTCIGHDLGWVN